MKTNHICSHCGKEDNTAPPAWIWLPSLTWTATSFIIVFVLGIVKIIELFYS